jgi:hypothetical protein
MGHFQSKWDSHVIPEVLVSDLNKIKNLRQKKNVKRDNIHPFLGHCSYL